jgi:hypothetical protein
MSTRDDVIRALSKSIQLDQISESHGRHVDYEEESIRLDVRPYGSFRKLSALHESREPTDFRKCKQAVWKKSPSIPGPRKQRGGPVILPHTDGSA